LANCIITQHVEEKRLGRGERLIRKEGENLVKRRSVRQRDEEKTPHARRREWGRRAIDGKLKHGEKGFREPDWGGLSCGQKKHASMGGTVT